LTPDSNGILTVECKDRAQLAAQITFLKKIPTYANLPVNALAKIVRGNTPLTVSCKWTDYRLLSQSVPPSVILTFQENSRV
jgi:hypothetical protein